MWWRPRSLSWWMALLFALGSMCFAAGALASQRASSSRPAIGVTFFVGSLFFTAASYIQYTEAAAAEHAYGRGRRRRLLSWEPGRIDWLAALIQLVGTLLFNLSTFAAMNHSLTTHQENARVWAPDVFGSAAFLVSSGLAFAEVRRLGLSLRPRSLSWWIAAVNLLGSVAFGVSAIASLTEPASGEPVSARIANAGTAFGGVCFLIGAVLLIPQAAQAHAGRAPSVANPPGGAG